MSRMKYVKSGTIGFFVMMAFGLLGPALALGITIENSQGSWSNVVGGSSVEFYDGNQEVRWGTGVNGSGQEYKSGFRFDEGIPRPLDVNAGEMFNIGDFTHYNNVIYGSGPTSLDLTLTMYITGANPTPLNINFTFLFNETLNYPSSGSCNFTPGYSEPCPDIVSFPNVYTDQTFALGGKTYTLELLGFSQDAGQSLVQQFITSEDAENVASLYGRFSEVTTQTPEPGTVLLFGTGLGALGVWRWRKTPSK